MENEKDAFGIAKLILKYIKENDVDEYTRLPSENEIALKYNVKRNVVRAAYLKLREQGYVYSIQGKGHFPIKKQSPLLYQHQIDIGFSEVFNSKNTDYENSLISWKLSDIRDNECDLLGLPKGEKLYRLKTLRSLNGEAFATCYSLIPQKHVPDMEQYFDTYASINQILIDYYGHQHPVRDDISIKAMMPTVDDIRYLKMEEGMPVLSITSSFSTPETGLIEYSIVHARGDRFIFNMDFTRHQNK